MAIGVEDPGFRALVRALGASLHVGDRGVSIATSAPEVVNFGVGDPQYSVGALTAQAHFAPYMIGGEIYLPFSDALRALGVEPSGDVLEPMLTSIDVQGYGPQAVVIAHGGGMLKPRLVSATPAQLVYEFDGVGTTLEPQRSVNAGGVRTIEITGEGTARDPKTTVTIDMQPGTRYDPPQAGSGEFEIAFGANGSAPPLVAPLRESTAVAIAAPQYESTPPPPPSDMVTSAPVTPVPQQPGPTSVGAVIVQNAAEGALTVTIPVTGNVAYEWHRLRAPDNRFWIDFTGAQLSGPPVDQAAQNPLTSLRVRQIDPQTVRVALSFTDENSVSVSPSSNGISITVGSDLVSDNAPRSGTGTVGALVSVNEPQTAITPVPFDDYGNAAASDETYWKFGPRGYVPTNPRLIVLDPGHGGGDRGSIHGELQEAVLNLDMAKRVETILLARGWQVKMTRSDDEDVKQTPMSKANAERYGYHNSDAYDLQARDDIANESGGRLFVSIHCNAFVNSGPNGTTVYYYKTSDVAFANVMDRDLASAGLGVKDDGTVKERLYVVAHAAMPAVLIESAFLSNPFDYAKLSSSDWRQQIAQAIADGIIQYAQQNPVAANQ
jgi:N-acetylmuramoyl-L-alanine amidase